MAKSFEFGQDGVAGNRFLDVRLDAVMVKLDVKDINILTVSHWLTMFPLVLVPEKWSPLWDLRVQEKHLCSTFFLENEDPVKGQVLINNIPLHDHIRNQASYWICPTR